MEGNGVVDHAMGIALESRSGSQAPINGVLWLRRHRLGMGERESTGSLSCATCEPQDAHTRAAFDSERRDWCGEWDDAGMTRRRVEGRGGGEEGR